MNEITLTFSEPFYAKEGLQRYYKIISEPEYIPEEEVYVYKMAPCEDNITDYDKIIEIV